MTEKQYEELKTAIFQNGVEAIDELLGYEHNINEDSSTIESRMDEVLDQMPEDVAMEFYNKYCNAAKTQRLHISMAYTFVGDTGIDIPIELLEGKTEEEKLTIAHQYAQDHIDEISVASNAEYVPYSDNFELEDCDFERE